ncbi:MAG: M20/M25/M40 family metallo-hydrolase [Pseudonocardiaceae bacterium]
MFGRASGVLAVLLGLTLFTVPASATTESIDSTRLRNAVTVAGIREHQRALQSIADANNGTRASGTAGYQASADYVRDRLVAAGYQVVVQPFQFPFFAETAPPVLARANSNARAYLPVTEVKTMEFSVGGDVTAPIQPVDITLPPTPAPSSTSGCEPTDFAAFTKGHVALVQRGACPFTDKARNAQLAGASAVIIFNEGQPDRRDVVSGELAKDGTVGIPVLGTSFAVGAELAEAAGDLVQVVTHTIAGLRNTVNVIADSPTGRDDRVVVVGGHLDSVLEGPGINDNGSGTATILEIAEQLAALRIEPRNTLRFAFWGAEELGLLGSKYYVATLPVEQRSQVAVNLNFDMLGSPNFVSFVYDGDGSSSPPAGPPGSGPVEQVFTDYFAAQGLPAVPTPFTGRSDYGPFVGVGIPAGGLFSGAEGIKTPEQAARFGGTAGLPYDSCYHKACDTVDNASEPALDQLGDAAAHAVLTFALTTSEVRAGP